MYNFFVVRKNFVILNFVVGWTDESILMLKISRITVYICILSHFLSVSTRECVHGFALWSFSFLFHIYIYMYMYVYMYVCMCICMYNITAVILYRQLVPRTPQGPCFGYQLMIPIVIMII